MAFQVGYNKKIYFQVTGAGASFRVDVVSKDLEEQVDKLDVTDSYADGVQALLAGIFRATVNARCLLDDTKAPYTTAPGGPEIRAGKKGVITFQISNSGATFKSFSVPVMVTKASYKGEVNGKEEWDATFELDSLSGTYTYPS